MKTWVDKFKLALIKEEIETLGKLLDNIDYKGVDLNEMKSLIEEAIKLVNRKKDSLNQSRDNNKHDRVYKCIRQFIYKGGKTIRGVHKRGYISIVF